MTSVESARLIANGRIQQNYPIEEALKSMLRGMQVLPVSFELAATTTYLPSDFPSDPMDRIIAATARVKGIPPVTADEKILACKAIRTIW